MPGGAPRNGPCSPWCSGPEIAAQPWMAVAIQRALAGENDLEPFTGAQVDLLCAQAADSASMLLYELSGRQFTGECGPVTVRPVARPVDVDTRGWSSYVGAGWNSSWGTCYGGGIGAGANIVNHFGCSIPPSIDLGAFPITQIVLVKIDGVEIPADEYELRDYRTLIRVRPTAASVPTERYGWPTCQINSLPDTQDGTFSVTYRYGQPAPAAGKLAAVKLGEYLALPQLGDDTHYPRRVTSMTRQGVSAQVVDVMDIVKTGATGIYEVDLFLRATNPKQLQQPSAVWSPDLGRPRRQATASLA